MMETDSPTRAKGRRPRRGPGRWYYIFLGILSVGTLGAAMTVGVITGYINSLPPIERLENYDPPEASTVYDRSGNKTIAQFSKEKRRVLRIEEIPKRLQQAFVAIEDERFYEHFGVDLKGVARSVVTNIQRGYRSQGASTITMQLPRNILTENIGREKLWERKLKETLLTFQIERRYSKPQILAFYMNHVFLGHNSYGIHAAAETYFNKPPGDLTLSEAAIIAGIPQKPSVYNPITDPEKCRKRRDLVLGRMRELNMIGKDEYEAAKAEPVRATPGGRRTNVAQSEFPYFVDALFRDLTQNYGVSRDNLNEQGLVIRSTIEPEYQQIAEEELSAGLQQVEREWNARKAQRYWLEMEELTGTPSEGQTRLAQIKSIAEGTAQVEFEGYKGTVALPAKLPYHDPERILRAGNRLDVKIKSVDYSRRTFEVELADQTPVQGSVVVLEARTGNVLALVGGADFRDAASAGQYNRAVQGGRQAGSTVKPFYYAAALKRGFGPHDVIIDEKISYPTDPPYQPQNYEKRFFGPTTLIEGLEHSRNVVTVRLYEALGLRKAMRDVVIFDIAGGDANWKRKFRPELAMSLGSVDMNALEMAGAYLPFTNQGAERRPQFFSMVEHRDGSAPLRPNFQESVLMDPVVNQQMVYILRQVVTGGTGLEAIGEVFPSPPYPPIAGKTGTTDASTDAWFAGFSPDLVIVVYIGFDTPRTLGPKMTGGKVAGPIWASIYKRLYVTRDDWKMTFDAPAGLDAVDICGATGKRASDICGSYSHKIFRNVPYKRGKAPSERCDGYVREPIIAPVGSFGQADGQGWVAEGEGENSYDYTTSTPEDPAASAGFTRE